MARLFISYKYSDMKTAQKVERHLLAKNHSVAVHVGAAVAGNWRTKFSQALVRSDAFVVLLGDDGLTSKNVVGEIGAARAIDNLRGMPLLPVLIGEMPIPEFIGDIFCLRLKSDADDDVAQLVAELDKSIRDSVAVTPRIFVSHRHIDEPVVAALVSLLEQAFNIGSNDIRCTSVKPYMLPPGARTSEQLRVELAKAELVLGIVSPDTTQSNYVLCELGAAWGRDVPTFPLLARGATATQVPPPLNERHCVTLQSEEECLELIEHIASKTTLVRKDVALVKLSQEAKRLSALAVQPANAENAKAKTSKVGSGNRR